MTITSQKTKSRHNTVQGACSILSSGSHASWRFISLTQGKFAIVDAENYEWLNQWKWRVKKGSRTFYAVRTDEKKKPFKKLIFMHNQILNCTKGKEIDHKNHKGYDNRILNLRCCTRSQNNQNRFHIPNQYKGVSWNKHAKKWHSRIQYNGKRKHLGYFDSIIEAAKAYDVMALELFGEFACLNFPCLLPTSPAYFYFEVR